nr:MAG TPA: hypothetical protein [Caudoviricetes sp.]
MAKRLQTMINKNTRGYSPGVLFLPYMVLTNIII